MTPEEFRAVYPRAISWIGQTLNAHLNEAKIVARLPFRRLPHYFSSELLKSTKVVFVDRVPMPPLSSWGLIRFAQWVSGDYDGISYLDTFFVKSRLALVERLHFHELIHIVQWRLLGPEAFLAAYAAGLERFGTAIARWRE
jgi:hypothetical protein